MSVCTRNDENKKGPIMCTITERKQGCKADERAKKDSTRLACNQARVANKYVNIYPRINVSSLINCQNKIHDFYKNRKAFIEIFNIFGNIVYIWNCCMKNLF